VEDRAADEVDVRRQRRDAGCKRGAGRPKRDRGVTGDRSIVPAQLRNGQSESKVLRPETAVKKGIASLLNKDLPRIDETDRKIIGELISEGRVSLAELGRRVSLSSPAVAERVQRLERAGIITGYRAELDLRRLGYPLTAIVRIKPAPGQLPRIPELAAEIPQVGECHRITGEDCFFLKVHLRSIDELGGLLDRFLVYGETTTSLVNATPIARRDPPLGDD
jgi:Lrp/AsnC family leucine-responsive transcriptional regulator